MSEEDLLSAALEPDASVTPAQAPLDELSVLLITLLKGVIYREADESLWSALLRLQTKVRDYCTVINLELMLDEAEGYAFFKSQPEVQEETSGQRLPRLVARRPLSFPVSLMLALLRKRLAEFDAGGGETRLVMTREEIVDLVRVFLADSSNEARITDQAEASINRVVDLGFLRKLKAAPGATASGAASYEVQRILKAFVDAQWLAEFDTRLAGYLAHLGSPLPGDTSRLEPTGGQTDE